MTRPIQAMPVDDFAAGGEEMRCGVLANLADIRRRLEHAAERFDSPDLDPLDALDELRRQIEALPVGRENDMREPGETIARCHCPCCGASLEVMHGDEPGEVSVIGEEVPRG